MDETDEADELARHHMLDGPQAEATLIPVAMNLEICSLLCYRVSGVPLPMQCMTSGYAQILV
jgi:hypothetical protein